MRTKTIKSSFVFSVVVLIFVGAVVAIIPKGAFGDESVRKIVVWKDGVSDNSKDEVVRKLHVSKNKNLKIVNGTAVTVLDKKAEKMLREHPDVLRLDDDVLITTLEKTSDLGRQVEAAAQSLPWGIDRIDADLVWPTGNTGDPVKVGVIDTGISSKHSDLKTNIKGGVNTIQPAKSWNDDNGHGSHVAGTIGALKNTIGVVGAAPDVDLYAIKVLGANGSGFLSDVIEGLGWAVTNGMQVVNMSLGTASDVQSLHDAITAAYNAGLVVVAAAGNSGGAVGYPASYPEVIAVSATDSNNNLASFSSRGPEVDLAAPGVSIYSTYKGTGYATLSGTSMASPHVAGTAALVLNTPIGSYDADADGAWDPTEVKQKLQDRATDLGTVGFDNLFGAGLMNAFSAVQP